MKGAFVENRYYTDDGATYAYKRLAEEFAARGVALERTVCPIIVADETRFDYDFAVFWNKDVAAALALERSGIVVVNDSRCIEICDDKQKTAAALVGLGVRAPRTVFAPHAYESGNHDDGLAEEVKELGLPIIVKESRGSQGRQVYLARSVTEAMIMHDQLGVTPHLFQSFEGDEIGADLRVYVVGGKVAGWCKRRNTTSFRSNLASGGKVEACDLPEKTKREAERIATVLGLEFGSVDFLPASEPLFVEANSSAYIRGVESLGFNVAGKIAERVIEVTKCKKK